MKRKYFFRNLGTILTFAIIGTTLSAFLIGGLMYGAVQLMPSVLSQSFSFLDVYKSFLSSRKNTDYS